MNTVDLLLQNNLSNYAWVSATVKSYNPLPQEFRVQITEAWTVLWLQFTQLYKNMGEIGAPRGIPCATCGPNPGCCCASVDIVQTQYLENKRFDPHHYSMTCSGISIKSREFYVSLKKTHQYHQ